jgi:hypothetical protein
MGIVFGFGFEFGAAGAEDGAEIVEGDERSGLALVSSSGTIGESS